MTRGGHMLTQFQKINRLLAPSKRVMRLVGSVLVWTACRQAPAPAAAPASPPPAPCPLEDAGQPAVTSAPAVEPAPPAASPPRCPRKEATPEDPIGGPWVTFYAPEYRGDYGPTNGPHWSFGTPKLPALSRDGKRILVFRGDHSLGASPNVDVVVQRVSDGAVLSKVSLLDEGAFQKAHEQSSDVESRRRAYDALATRIAGHVTQVNARLEKEGWSPLTECDLDIDSSDTQPGCSMRDQELRCGDAVRVTYREPRLDVWANGRAWSLRDQRWVAPPVRYADRPDATVDVRGCIGAAWLEPVRGVLIVLVDYVCHVPGDWCSVPSGWHVVYTGPLRPPPPPPTRSAADTCPTGMIAIPAGSFTMGSASGEIDERPPHAVNVPAFCLDATEVTVAAYAACVKAGGCYSPEEARWAGPGSYLQPEESPECNWSKPGRESHPMNCVAWSFARRYCEAAGKRLPTEEEWEYAARGPEGRTYPWGEGAPGQGVCWNGGYGSTCAAGASSADKTPLGVLDLAGDVREWTASRYAYYDRCEPESTFATRGGSGGTKRAADLRGAKRGSDVAAAYAPDLGFRCAKSR